MLIEVAGKDAEAVSKALARHIRKLPEELRQSLTRPQIRAEFAKSRKTYDSRRITRALRRRGVNVAHGPVERLTRQDGLQARPGRRFVRTTDSSHE